MDRLFLVISDSLDTLKCNNQTIDVTDDGESHIEFRSLSPKRNCEVTFKTYSEGNLMVFFDKLNVSGSSAFTWLELHDGNTRRFTVIGAEKFYGSKAPADVYTTTGQYLTLYFRDDLSRIPSHFSLYVTSFHTGACTSDEYKCDNGRCIDDSLQCFGNNPCGDYSNCKYGNSLSDGEIAGICVGGVLAVIIVIVSVSFCMQRLSKVQCLKKQIRCDRTNLVTAIKNNEDYNFNLPVQQSLEPVTTEGATGTTHQLANNGMDKNRRKIGIAIVNIEATMV